MRVHFVNRRASAGSCGRCVPHGCRTSYVRADQPRSDGRNAPPPSVPQCKQLTFAEPATNPEPSVPSRPGAHRLHAHPGLEAAAGPGRGGGDRRSERRRAAGPRRAGGRRPCRAEQRPLSGRPARSTPRARSAAAGERGSRSPAGASAPTPTRRSRSPTSTAAARPDLIVFAIEVRDGANRGYYRVGRSLDADGAVTGGWTGWTQIPDWFSTDNQGGDIAVADLNGDGTPELVVVIVDKPTGGHYRVGWKPRRHGQGRRRVGRVDGDPGLAGGRQQGARHRRRRPRRRRPARAARARPRPPHHRLGPGRDRPRVRGLGTVDGSARRPRPDRHLRRAGLPGRRRAPGADGARQRRRRGGSRRGPRRRRGGDARRLADPRPQLPDPGRPRRAAAHRRRAVLLGLRRRPRRPRGQAVPHARVALPEPPLQLAAHADRPVLRRPDVPGGRPAAGGRRHRSVRAVPRHPRRARLRPRGPALDPRAPDARGRAGTRR